MSAQPDQALTAEETLHLIERTAHIGTYDFDIVAEKRTWSDELYRILGLPVGSAIDGTSYVQRVHPDDLAVVLAHRSALRRGIPFRHEHRVVHDDGAERWVETSMQPVLDAGGTVVRLFGTGVDITKRKRAELQLAYLAQHDDLTGLPNRALLAENLATALAEAARTGRHVAVVYVDLDDFKRINDTYGHFEGDRVIRRCAECLTACMRAGDVVARVGGDEFVVIVAETESSTVATRAVATRAVERMRAALAEPISIGSDTITLSASFGISCFPADGDSADHLIHRADLAMYDAKNAPHGGDPERRNRLQWRWRNRFGAVSAPGAERAGTTSRGAVPARPAPP